LASQVARPHTVRFFLWGYVKDVVDVPPLPNYLQELRQCIIAAVATINRDMLERVWTDSVAV
jgi:hypothetical protein